MLLASALATLAFFSSSILAQDVIYDEASPEDYDLDPDDVPPHLQTQLEIPGMVKHTAYQHDDGDVFHIFVHKSYAEPDQKGEHKPVFKREYGSRKPVLKRQHLPSGASLHKREDKAKPAEPKKDENKASPAEPNKDKPVDGKDTKIYKVHVVEHSAIVAYQDLPRPANATKPSNQTLAQTSKKECTDLGGTLTCASAPKKEGGEVLQWRCRIAYFGGNPIEDKWVTGDEGKCQRSETEAEKEKKAEEARKKKEEDRKKREEEEKKKKADEEAKKKKAEEEKKKKKLPKFDDGGRCGMSTFKNLTTSNAAYTGGCQAIHNWAAKRLGKWAIGAKVEGDINLIVAGSNSGANCRFVIRNNNEHTNFIGTADVRDLIRDSRLRFQVTYSNKTGVGERMGAEGHMKCDKQYKNGTKFEQKVDWAILKYDGSV
ncbi:hypothetical protein PgNI_11101 [Pyricularia grisea]|uniref:Ecp2 effector protein-like domain-containing protein n=1 Tax=Pyricularia grisea TaxID=148305 RepID=A0A6P8AYQ1_PYRGI|nr:hypothetical protein PgNI_11101 [Pyricularia grisea]TLD07472.1 hypothetical protein PgNI_11101 [Pyricularia grisea]